MDALSGSLLVSRNGLASAVRTPAPAGKDPKAWGAAQDFEAVFLNTMVGQMFEGLDGDGPLGGAETGAWRGLLVEEWSKSIAASGGVGLAEHVYRDLIALQERRS